MEYKADRELWEIIPLLKRLDRGEALTEAEQAELAAIRELKGFGWEGELPRSISTLTALESLDLTGTPVRDLTPLRGLTALENLNLNGTQVSHLTPLRGLTALRFLNLGGTKVGDLTPLRGLEALETLVLSGTQVSNLTPLSGLTALESLYLTGTPVSDLTPLRGLEALETLDLTGTPVIDLTPLSGLPALTNLGLTGTQVSDLTPLAGLTALEELHLWNTRVEDVEPLRNLTSLRVLALGGTRVRELSGLSGLRGLKSLHLWNTQVRDLRPLAGLKELQSLDLRDTPVEDLRPLEGLEKLKTLQLHRTRLRDLEPLARLPGLKRLELNGSRLRMIPRSLYERVLPVCFAGYFFDEQGLLLNDVNLSTQPISIFREVDAVIRAYYDAPKKAVREAKVIFLGDGGAGKTHTIKRILKKGCDEGVNTDVTLGISIDRYDVEDRDFHINFWDFGGQENMLAMHRCFLTERTLYVVVLNSRWDLDDQARRWLDSIRSFAPEAPVILAVNLWEGVHRYAMDTGRILREDPNVFIQHYAAKGPDQGDFRALTALIEEKAEDLDSCSMELPEDWAAILEELREMAERKPVPGEKYRGYIDRTDYLALCEKHNLGGEQNEGIRAWLLEWFNDLGVCFSYHRDQQTRKELDSYKVLNPRWLTGAIYYLINQKENIGENGHVSHFTIKKLLKYPDPEELREGRDRDYILPNVRYEPEECRYILEVMRKFGLSYQIGPEMEFIPALCASDTPADLRPGSWRECVSYEFRYGFLPDSVVQRLMVRLRKNWQFTKLWRRGFRYDDPHNGLITVADAGGGRDRLRLDVYSTRENRGWDVMLSLISQITAINAELNLKPEEFIIVRGERGEIPAPAGMILQAKEKGVRSLHLYSRENGLVERNVDEILGRTYSGQIIDTAAAVARADNRSLSETVPQIIYNYTIYGDFYHNAESGGLLELLKQMVEQNVQVSDRFTEFLLSQLEGSGDPDAEKLAQDVKKAEKGGVLRAVWNGVKSLPKLAAGVKSTLEDSKAAAAILKALWAYGPKLVEGIEQFQGLLPPGTGG